VPTNEKPVVVCTHKKIEVGVTENDNPLNGSPRRRYEWIG
jgi:hypothetical protein